MGNSQSYDVTNVHHRNSGQCDETAGTVKQLRDDIHPRIEANERDKQENKSPKTSGQQELSMSKQHQEKSGDTTTIPKLSTVCAKKDEAVSDVTQGMGEIALESLYLAVPPETLPLDAKPTQCSYD